MHIFDDIYCRREKNPCGIPCCNGPVKPLCPRGPTGPRGQRGPSGPTGPTGPTEQVT